MVIGIIGSRRRDTEEDFKKTLNVFNKIYQKGDIICSGLCPHGGDWFAVLISLGLDWISDTIERRKLYKLVAGEHKTFIPSIWFPAEWKKYGRAAGFKRNTDIAKMSDILIACVSLDRTGGTEDTIKKYTKLNKRKLILV
jgi:hypothetical protein